MYIRVGQEFSLEASGSSQKAVAQRVTSGGSQPSVWDLRVKAVGNNSANGCWSENYLFFLVNLCRIHMQYHEFLAFHISRLFQRIGAKNVF